MPRKRKREVDKRKREKEEEEERIRLLEEQKHIQEEEEQLLKERKERLEQWKKQRQKVEDDHKRKYEEEKKALEEAGESTLALEQEEKRVEALRELVVDGDEDIRGIDEEEDEVEEQISDQKEEDEVDPLDQFMESVEEEVKQENATWEHKHLGIGRAQPNRPTIIGIAQPLDIGQTEETTVDEQAAMSFKLQQETDGDVLLKYKARKKSKLAAVDHETIEYDGFRKDLYIEAPELSAMTREEIITQLPDLKDVKIRGKNYAKPVLKWQHCGLPMKLLNILVKRLKYERPTAIQSQALPIVMSGRDTIGVAKTGSGKTLAYVLPMLRHVMDQRPLEDGDGPIAIVMVPTRELATQVYRVVRPIANTLEIKMTCLYGGTVVGEQISELKAGVHIAICTPGRLIDILSLNNGRITNLRRVTFVVLDEADRMFDMGFEPQVTRVIENTRPDRQTLMFSATFPRTVEMLAKQALTKPIEIIVDGRVTVCSDVYQYIEVRAEQDKFLRLLQLLGEFFERGAVLVFVQKQVSTEKLFKELLAAGYPCSILHGGLEQADRESNIADFKNGVIPILIATSVAARGLHVDNLNLVVNYDTPSHLEDYVHRVGRTGRAGKKGWAYTFITPSEGYAAKELIKALNDSGSTPLEELIQLSEEFERAKKESEELARLSSGFRSGGYGGKGFSFSEEETDTSNLKKKLQMLEYGDASTKESYSEDLNRALVTYQDATRSRTELSAERRMKAIIARQPKKKKKDEDEVHVAPEVAKAQEIAASISRVITTPSSEVASTAKEVASKSEASAAAVAAALETAKKIASDATTVLPDGRLHYEDTFVINDYPMAARWQVTRKDALASVLDRTGCAVTCKGVYVDESKPRLDGDVPIYLLIEGSREDMVAQTKRDIKKMMDQETTTVLQKTSNPFLHTTGRYSVL